MKNYLLITVAATAVLGACTVEGPQHRFDESGTNKVRTDFYEAGRLEKSTYYGKEGKTLYYDYNGKKISAIRVIYAGGKLSREYEITPTQRVERRVTAVDGRALQIVNYGIDGKLKKLQTLRPTGKPNCTIRYGSSGMIMDSLSAYIRYSYDPKTEQLNFEHINFADVKAEKSQRHDFMNIGIYPGALGTKEFKWEDELPRPIYQGPFRSGLSLKLPKEIFKDGLCSIYVYAGKRTDTFWSQGTEQWIQLRVDQGYKGYNWYLID